MKRFTAFIVALMLLMPSQAFAASPANQIGIEIGNSASGVVSAYYDNDTDQRLKVLVEKDGQKYYYNLDNTGKAENFSLQMGEGNYKVTIFENISSTSYRTVYSKTLFADFDEANLTYLQSVQSIDWNASMAAMAIASDLIKDKTTELEKVTAIHNYITTNVQYDYEKISTITTTYLPNIDQTLTSKKAICYDFASTFAGMLRSVGIPAKLVKGYTVNANGYHAWNEVYIDGAWVVIDASYDSQMKARSKPFEMIKTATLYTKQYEF